MVVNIIKSNSVISLNLPKKISGQYWLEANSAEKKLVSVEAVNGKWVIKNSKYLRIHNTVNSDAEYAELTPLSLYQISYTQDGETAIIFTESDDSLFVFSKFSIRKGTSLSVGRTQNNSICYANKYVSQSHAKISYEGNYWKISDGNSANGTFVNGKRVTASETRLIFGDLVYIMGLRIIVGNGFFAINNPGKAVSLHSEGLERLKPQVFSRKTLPNTGEKKYFLRSPRFHREVEEVEIKVDEPPQLEKTDSVPLAFMIGPSMTMGIASMSTGIITLNNVLTSGGKITSALPTLMMSVSMLLGCVLWPILTKKYEKKQKILAESKRQEKYLLYLNEVRDEIKKCSKDQSEILNENIVSPDECSERIAKRMPSLWERANGQSDFLNLRLGTGQIPLDLKLQISEKKFTMEDDSLQTAMLSLNSESEKTIKAPISVSLIDNTILGLFGNISLAKNMVKSLILQMIALHSYDELKLMLIAPESEENEWNFIKYIPHFWTDDKETRFYANNLNDVRELSAYIEKNILTRAENRTSDYSENSPYYVIISVDPVLSGKCDALKQLIASNGILSASVVFAAPVISNLPKETKTVISLENRMSRIYNRDDTSGREITFDANYVNENLMTNLAHDIAKIELDINKQMFTLPPMITFLEMFGVGKIEHLNALSRWKESNPALSLQTPVGVDTNGSSFNLDLHEKYHGPHGLIAGMTGSGKSEFVITYILSLAVNYHPDEVAFILIDYKGGGLTGAFEDPEKGIKLPHLAGTITNLDGASIKRSLISIQSELRRRQALFNDARRISNEGTMDIYKYQQLYRSKIVREPVPHLFVISDEFAELKSQQPEFMEQLISAARIGRSLGVHLILATQKPSGVVDDQIWSNSKFRVCLKVQDKADSQEMIKRPDAAELSQTGRFYLQVGFNEFFALGQSAWSGAEYYPSDSTEKELDESIRIVDNLGRTLVNAAPSKKNEATQKTVKQIVGVVKYLSDLAAEENISVKALWLDPIPDRIFIDELEEKYGYIKKDRFLNPVIGEYDDPFNQKQSLLTVPISADGNCIVYGFNGNGKTTFLTAVCYSLIRNHTADEVNIYIMDYGAETLRAFEKAPQVGGFVAANDEEKTINLFKMLAKEMENRKRLFADFGGGYAEYCRNSGTSCPNIVVLINNFSGFSEQYEDYLEQFNILSRDGVKYGIYFIISASSTNAVRFRTQQNFKTLFALQMNDPSDYSMIVGRTEGLIPSKYKGRGLVALEKVFEFQTAYCSDAEDISEFIRESSESKRRDADKFAAQIPVLPETVRIENVKASFKGLGFVPLGINRSTLETVGINLGDKVAFAVSAMDIVSLIPFAEEFCELLAEAAQTTVLDPANTLGEIKGVEKVSGDLNQTVESLFRMTVDRHNNYVDSGRDTAACAGYENRIYVIFGMQRLTEQLSDENKERIRLSIEKSEAFYNLKFIVMDSSSGFSSFGYEAWYKRHLSGAEGLWIGDGVVDSSPFKLNKITSKLYEEIGSEFGYYIKNGKPAAVKQLSNEIETEE